MLFDSLFDWLFDSLFVLLFDSLFVCLFDSLFDWLFDSLFDWLFDSLLVLFDHLFVLFDSLFDWFSWFYRAEPSADGGAASEASTTLHRGKREKRGRGWWRSDVTVKPKQLNREVSSNHSALRASSSPSMLLSDMIGTLSRELGTRMGYEDGDAGETIQAIAENKRRT